MSAVQSQLMAYKNSVNRVQALYVPDKFTTVASTASGNTDVWVSPNNFLLLGFTITVAGTLAVTGELTISLIDTVASGFPSGGPITVWEGSTFLPATAVGNAFFGQDYGGGYGYESGIGNTTLVIALSAALSTGHVYVNAWGTWDVIPSP